MKGKRYTSEQIIAKLREAEADLNGGQTIGQVCQNLGVSEQTFHRWRNQFGGMKSEAANRLKELEEENLRLKKAVAELTLDIQDPAGGAGVSGKRVRAPRLAQHAAGPALRNPQGVLDVPDRLSPARRA